MQRLNSVTTEQVELEVVQCDCGFHLGIDATWLDQSPNADDAHVTCPACGVIIYFNEVFPE